ncbi:hypothetical protein JI666_01160 [Bacillus sp. NTK071]|uniref:hypothetical protein n=1 Tax=Bacillus sp. NTK071 TaxID=2802175 RepID=UPI001A8E6937|nr:hypothetical protein [Bacillus sp. NTK071]MBN8207350.1 hypothetical protein [Bacillus sp. NTK071]
MEVSRRGWKQVFVILLMIICCVPVVGFSQSLEEKVTSRTKADPVVVNHRIKNKDLFVECVIPNFSFDQDNEKKDYHGYIDVFLDGKKHQTVKQAAFIVQNLPEGKHLIRLDIMREDGGRYLSLKEIEVEIK